MPKMSLDDIFDDELVGEVEVKVKEVDPEATRILSSFEEINRFIDRYGHVPGAGAELKPSVSERNLQLRLKGLLKDINALEILASHDRHNLLKDVEKKNAEVQSVSAPDEDEFPAMSLDEILDSDDELLSTDSDDIFNIKNVPTSTQKKVSKADWKSERIKCEDFDKFEPLFDECMKDLKSGRRKAIEFQKEQEIQAGEFFILNGVTVFVAEVGETQIRNRKKNARLRVIFDNGMEGNNLLRSLATELYKDPNGRRISSPVSGPLFEDVDDTEKGVLTGVVYVVRSLSNDPSIKALDGNLFKIGVTKGTLEDRIRNAVEDPTFLMAPVHPLRSFALMDVDPIKVENLLHRFFSEARLDIEIQDRFGRFVKPREWFLLPLPVVEKAIRLLFAGTIVDYEYDPGNGEIVLRKT